MSNKPKFHLGICMAGAVTAGSYTAGVIDYLIETLEAWQKAKDLQADYAPDYDVVIEVLSGASAGGMCAGITTAMLLEGAKPTRQSKMYKAWIELDDEGNTDSTIKKMLNTQDLTSEISSLLNSQPIDNVAENAIKLQANAKLPKYVAKDLDIIVTITNLLGIKYGIEFQSYSGTKSHIMSLHKDFMHFKLNTQSSQTDDFLPLDFSKQNEINLLKESLKATGAFPIGLKSRILSRNNQYMQNKAKNTIGVVAEDAGLKPLNVIKNPYLSLNVDGGVLNNEPFGEAEKILKQKAKKVVVPADQPHKLNSSLIMIDPFPSNNEIKDETKEQSILKIAPRIIGTFREQSLFKKRDLLEALSSNNYSKHIIHPTQSANSETEQPLNCSVLGAFGGFLLKDFREHDYQLGRRNCQQFLRKNFVFPFVPNDDTKNNEIHQNWSQANKARYLITEADGSTFLPIIPDVRFDNNNPTATVEPKPQLKKYPIAKLKELEPLIEKRVRRIFDVLIAEFSKSEEAEKSEAVKLWFKKNWFQRALSSVGDYFLSNIFKILKGKLATPIVNYVIKTVLRDLEKNKLLDY